MSVDAYIKREPLWSERLGSCARLEFTDLTQEYGKEKPDG